MADEFEGRCKESTNSGGEKRYADPYGLYRRWFETWDEAREGETETSVGADEIEEMWRRWFRESSSAESLGPLWERMARSIKEETLSGGSLPEDPVESFLQWYEATSEEWVKAADELLDKSEFLESNANLQQDKARSHQKLKKTSEETLKKLRIPSRSDVAGVAKLIVGVENKLDRIEEAFGEFVYGGSEPATAESVRGLEERMEHLEDKMDQILAALEKGES